MRYFLTSLVSIFIGLTLVLSLFYFESKDLELGINSTSFKMILESQSYFIHILYIFPLISWIVGSLVYLVMDKKHQIIEHQKHLSRSSKLSAVGEMAAGIAHEINNPLTVINMQSELIKNLLKPDVEKIKNKEKIEKSIEILQSTTKKITKIISGLKNFSRDGSDDPILKVSANKLVEDVLVLAQYKLEKNTVTVVNEIENEQLIYCRESQIQQVLLNLISNAIDAIKDKKEKWIKVSLSENKDQQVIKVIDSGVNFPKELSDKIFNPFFTTKKHGEGTGVGLHISKNIIESNKGKIFIDTKEKNTTFVIVLPQNYSETLK